MPAIKRMAKAAMKQVNTSQRINWHPGHMFSGMQAMIGKLNTVDCVIEVHDARIPFIGRNKEFRGHLGVIKPHILVLNKADLADLSNWDDVKKRLQNRGDHNVVLTDLSGDEFSYAQRGYDQILPKAMSLIHGNDRHNRESRSDFTVMIVGIPNVGKSTLINRLRQYHLGASGEATKTGVLQPSATKNLDMALKLSLCSAINDRALKPMDLAAYLLDYLHKRDNYTYAYQMGLEEPAKDLFDLCHRYTMFYNSKLDGKKTQPIDYQGACWHFIYLHRKGRFGKVMYM